MLLLKELCITSCVADFIQREELLNNIYKLDSTLQNSSENQLLTVHLYDSEKFALNVNKEIIRLTISNLKDSLNPFLTKSISIFFFTFIALLLVS